MDLPLRTKAAALRCPKCHGCDVVHSLRHGMMDLVMHRFGREPRHCRFCGRRFYIDPKKIGQAEP